MMADTDVIVERDVQIVAPDGVRLATDIYRPASNVPVPCLVQRVAYDKSLPESIHGALDVGQALRRGFAVLVQDCRGRFASEGTFEPFVHEGSDGAATVEWAAGQEWCDGSVGMFGRSYSGFAQWATAALEPEGLMAIAPMFSGTDPSRDWFRAGGAFERGFALLWGLRHLAPDMLAREVRDGRRPPSSTGELLELVDGIDQLYLHEDEDDSELFERIAPVVLGLLAERTAVPSTSPATTKVPSLVVAGWFDIFLAGALRAVERLAESSVSNRLVVGPWAHGGNLSGVFAERNFGARASASALGLSGIQLDWFDRWLRPPAEPVAPVGSGAVLFAMGRDSWQLEERWPPPDARPWRLWPGSTGGPDHPVTYLSEERSDADGFRITVGEIAPLSDDPMPTVGGQTFLPGLEVAANAGPRDQRALLGRSDLVLLRTAPLATEVEVAGWVTAEAELRGAPPDLPLVVRLLDLWPDGRATLVCEGASHPAKGGGEAPAPFEVGATWYRFGAGHRVGLAFSAASFPRFSPPSSFLEPLEIEGPAEERPILTLPVLERPP